MWFLRLSNSTRFVDLPQPDQAAAEEAAALCRKLAPSVRAIVICVPEKEEA